MIDCIKADKGVSVRHSCAVLGFRRQTYFSRKGGHRPEELDELLYSSISAKTLTDVLNKVVAWRERPAYIRCDNGPEFISKQLKEWADTCTIELRFIQPGKPSQNGLIECLNATLRTECLNLEWFKSLDQLNEQIQEWSVVYSTIRPHSSIDFKTPDEMELLTQSLYFSAVAA